MIEIALKTIEVIETEIILFGVGLLIVGFILGFFACLAILSSDHQ